MKDFFSDLPKQNNKMNGKIDNPNPQPPARNNPCGRTTQIPSAPDAAIVTGVIDITKESIRCFTEYAKCREHEITERKRISAALKAVQYQIDAQKEVYLKKLEKDSEERNRLYDMAEKTLGTALELEDKEMLQLCCNLILNVYTKPCGDNSGMSFLSGGVYASL